MPPNLPLKGLGLQAPGPPCRSPLHLPHSVQIHCIILSTLVSFTAHPFSKIFFTHAATQKCVGRESRSKEGSKETRGPPVSFQKRESRAKQVRQGGRQPQLPPSGLPPSLCPPHPVLGEPQRIQEKAVGG